MNFKSESFRYAGVILNEVEYIDQFQEVIDVITNISDKDLIEKHNSFGNEDIEKTPKSLSPAINSIFKERFLKKGWNEESPIFQDTFYKGDWILQKTYQLKLP